MAALQAQKLGDTSRSRSETETRKRRESGTERERERERDRDRERERERASEKKGRGRRERRGQGQLDVQCGDSSSDNIDPRSSSRKLPNRNSNSSAAPTAATATNMRAAGSDSKHWWLNMVAKYGGSKRFLKSVAQIGDFNRWLKAAFGGPTVQYRSLTAVVGNVFHNSLLPMSGAGGVRPASLWGHVVCPASNADVPVLTSGHCRENQSGTPGISLRRA